jgi:type VI secretion system protein ImpH
MASQERLTDADLIDSLAKYGHRYGFVRAVQLVELLFPSKIRVGEIGPTDEENIRFQHDPSLKFHAGDITSIVPRNPQNGVKFTYITSTFFGLFGTTAPLPPYMAEDVLMAEASEQPSLRGFYDIFHHRLISLFYRSWQKYRFSASFRNDFSDLFSKRALSFVGIDIQGGISEEGLTPEELLSIAPLAGQKSRASWVLRTALRRLLPGVNIDVDCFARRRIGIQGDNRVALGRRNTTLNRDKTVGQTVEDRTGRYKLKIGPCDHEDYDALQPGGRLFPKLQTILAHFSGGVLEAEIEVGLTPASAPRFTLSSKRDAILARTTRLGSQEVKMIRSKFCVRSDKTYSNPYLVDEDDKDDD